MVFLFVLIICLSIFYSQITIRFGKISLIGFTFLLAFTIDQLIQFPVLTSFYYVIVRRFSFLKVNEKEWLDYESYQDKQENEVPKLKQNCLKMLEHPTVESFSFLVINLYAVFILFDLTFSDLFNMNP
jgi:hypothetical protein